MQAGLYLGSEVGSLQGERQNPNLIKQTNPLLLGLFLQKIPPGAIDSPKVALSQIAPAEGTEEHS